MKREIIIALAAVTLSTLFTGCSTTPKAKEVRIIVPAAPEEPRVFYVTSYRGESNFEISATFAELLGEKRSSIKSMVKPYGVASTGKKTYAADTASGIVFCFDEELKKVTFIGNGNEGQLQVPVGVAIDDQKNVYVSDAKQKKVFGYTPEGKVMFAIGKKYEFARPAGIGINRAMKRLYVVDTKSHEVKVYDLSGKSLFTFGKRGHGDAEFNFPTNIAIDQRNGNVAIVDTQNFRVQVFDKEGSFLFTFGKIGDRPGGFARPKGIGIDSDGHFYVADTAFNMVQIFNEKGELMLFFGGGGSGPGKFHLMNGLYVDENDRITIADSFSGNIHVFQYVSERWKRENPEKYLDLKRLEVEVEETKESEENR